MGFDTFLLLVPDGPKLQIGLLDAEGGLGLGELHVGTPEFFRAPVGHITAQQVTSFTESRPFPPAIQFLPADLRKAVGIRINRDFKSSRRSRVLAQQSPDALAHRCGQLLALFAAGHDLLQPLLDAFLEPFVHGLLFLFPLRTAAEKKYFLATRSGTQAHLQAFPHWLPILSS